MGKYLFVGVFVFAWVALCVAQETEKPTNIITQDGEVDDISSFVRFLLYTPDMDVRGIVATNSKWQKKRSWFGLDI